LATYWIVDVILQDREEIRILKNEKTGLLTLVKGIEVVFKNFIQSVDTDICV